jgi:hypothetical protein
MEGFWFLVSGTQTKNWELETGGSDLTSVFPSPRLFLQEFTIPASAPAVEFDSAERVVGGHPAAH